jgi:cytochrome c5
MSTYHCSRIRLSSLLIALLLSVGSACAPGSTARAESAPDGKKVFEDQKCTRCHKPGSKREMKGPIKHKPEDLKAILKHEKDLNGKKHKGKFKGTDAELDALVKWLVSLK